MKATAAPSNSNTFEALNNMSMMPNNSININKETPIIPSIPSNTANNKDNNNISTNNTNNTSKPKGGFGFIKKGGNAAKSTTTTNDTQGQGKGSSLLQTLGSHPESSYHGPNIEVKNNVNIKPKKKLENILNVYRIKMQEYHHKMFNYNEDFKNFIRKLTQIRKELNDLDKEVFNKKEEANNLFNKKSK